MTDISSLAADPLGDDSGSDTFRRYRWQSKMAVISWLGSLESSNTLLGVICEGAEDMVLVYSDRTVYIQLKTRTKGSWSGSKVCTAGGGIDSLINTFKLTSPQAPDALELWLEGPAGETKETATFFGRPANASEGLRRKMRELGLTPRKVEPFLALLTIRPDRPPRGFVDDVVMQTIAALWPSFGSGECRELYARLLEAAEAAQAGELAPYDDAPDVLRLAGHKPEHESWEVVLGRCLSARHLKSMTPPLPDASRDELLERIQRGDSLSPLQMKMAAAGASPATIEDAQTRRALAAARRFELRALGEESARAVDLIEDRLLEIGNARVALAALTANSNPTVAARSGEYVALELKSHPADLVTADQAGIFGDGSLLYGLLCQVSDDCKFWWKQP